MILDAQGNLYGTAAYGGDTSASACTSSNLPAPGCGVVFELSPTVTLSATSLSFGNQSMNSTSAAKSVTITNSNSAVLDINSITTSANFNVSATTCGARLAAGKKCKVSVTFTPTTLGSEAGLLSFSAAGRTRTVALTGTGIEPEKLTPATATYSKQKVGTTSKPKTFTLTNDQSTALTGITVSTSGDFAVSATTCTTTLVAKGKCTISVTFTPASTGTRRGQLIVRDSASNSPQTTNLTGTGD